MAGETSEKPDSIALFMRVYTNLPLEERTRTVLVFENEPISWEVARNEIVHRTMRGEKILAKLVELKII